MWRKNWPNELQHLTQFDIPLNTLLSLRVGGICDALVTATTRDELQAVCAYADTARVPITVLGGGYNTLAPDEGVRGIIVRCGEGEFTDIVFEDDTCTVGAAVTMPDLLKACLIAEKTGVEFLAGIPGTLGGAVSMNAGIKTGAIGDRVTSVVVMDLASKIVQLSGEDLRFSYRAGNLPKGIVLSVVLQLSAGQRHVMMCEIYEHLHRRREWNPTTLPNAGCIFKNPSTGSRTAAQLIEACGLKGARVGGAEVCPRHANFIHNTGSATSQDIIDLMGAIGSTVCDKHGVTLEPELKFLGMEWEGLDAGCKIHVRNRQYTR